MTIIVQKLKRGFSSRLYIASRYYEIVSALNELQLTEREVQLVTSMAVYGAEDFDKKDFCKEYDTTQATVNNIMAKLRKKNILVKRGKSTVVNPLICLDFSKDIQLEIKLINE
jgi:hypothetical protein